MSTYTTVEERLARGEFTLIAEIGVNYYDIAAKLHVSAMEAAKLMVTIACNAGIPAVKFQTYKAETLAAKYSPAYWDTTEEKTTSQFELFKKFDSFGYEEYAEIKSHCERVGIEFCSTPFDFDSADYLYDLMNFYKISSSDVSNLPFIAYIAKKNKPIIMSVGAAEEEEIDRAVAIIQRYNDKKLTLLHCVLEYPTPYEHANLNKISTLKLKFPDMYIGYSDHTKPDASYEVIKTAYLLGAIAVEKHFTLDKTIPGNDHYHAMDGHDAEEILKGIAYIESIRGKGDLDVSEGEAPARKNARRSVVTTMRIRQGEKILENMLTCKRPGTGIEPKDRERLIGKIAACDIEEDTILTWDMIIK